jgi:tRNA (guanine-N7-)-methyltransferase
VSGGAAPAPIVGAEELRERGLADAVGPPPVVLEIGFGRGEVLLEMAVRWPEASFLGVEVSRKRVEKTARRVARAALANVRLVSCPAEYLLERVLPPTSIAECWINFPDPWPKKRHHKRRLIRPDVVVLLVRALEPGAVLHVATDHEGYAEWIDGVLSRARGLENLHAPQPFARERPAARSESRYEAEFRAEGRPLHYFAYRRT